MHLSILSEAVVNAKLTLLLGIFVEIEFDKILWLQIHRLLGVYG